MKDLGFQKSFLQEIDTSKKQFKGYWGLRKLFRDYLTKVHVTWYDSCCPEASSENIYPVRFNGDSEVIEIFDGSNWEDAGLPSSQSSNSFSTQFLTANSITAFVNTDAILIQNNVVQERTAVAHDVTATLTVADIEKGFITSTSAAAVGLTLPDAADFGRDAGNSIEFMVDNSAGANTITVSMGTGITAVTAVVTGSDTMTVASGAVGTFRIFFTSPTVAKIARII